MGIEEKGETKDCSEDRKGQIKELKLYIFVFLSGTFYPYFSFFLFLFSCRYFVSSECPTLNPLSTSISLLLLPSSVHYSCKVGVGVDLVCSSLSLVDGPPFPPPSNLVSSRSLPLLSTHRSGPPDPRPVTVSLSVWKPCPRAKLLT